MGQSCGGGLAVQLALEDPRVSGLGVWNSGAGLGSGSSANAIPLDRIKGPVLIITGSEPLDIAFASGKNTFDRLNHVPVFMDGATTCSTLGRTGRRMVASSVRLPGIGSSG